MPALRRRAPIRSVGSARRRTTWARFSGAVALAAAGTINVDLLSTYRAMAGASTVGATVLRTHLALSVSNALSAGDVLSLGILRGQNTDVGNPIPVGAPSPIGDPYEDWAYWAAWTADAVGPSFWPGLSNQFRLDLKAQRKLPELQMTWILSITGTFAAARNLNYVASTLLALP